MVSDFKSARRLPAILGFAHGCPPPRDLSAPELRNDAQNRSVGLAGFTCLRSGCFCHPRLVQELDPRRKLLTAELVFAQADREIDIVMIAQLLFLDALLALIEPRLGLFDSGLEVDEPVACRGSRNRNGGSPALALLTASCQMRSRSLETLLLRKILRKKGF